MRSVEACFSRSCKRQLMRKIENWDWGRKTAEGGTMTFWPKIEAFIVMSPRGAELAGECEFCDLSVRVRVPCGVGGVIARMSFSRL
jgi:hypothetical protein